MSADSLFQPARAGYGAFVQAIDRKAAIKGVLEADAALKQTLAHHHEVQARWMLSTPSV